MSGAHILVYPYLSAGHIIPLLDLTHRLHTRGLTVTVVVTPNNLSLLNPLLSTHASSSTLQPLVLPSPQPSNFSSNRLIDSMHGLRLLHYPLLLQWFSSHPSPPVAIISDFFLGWTHQLATELGLPRVVFSPSAAFAFAVQHQTWIDSPKNDGPSTVSFPNIPGSPRYPWHQISHIYRSLKEGDPDREFYKSTLLANLVSWGVVFNSFSELEGVYIDHVKKEAGHDRIWAVGPLLPPDDDLMRPANRGGSSSVPCHEVMTWLDARREHSVVYVCFGSRAELTREQTDGLAAGLEKSGVHFIWCVRGVMPAGYEERVAGRGFVINGWAPQVEILRHRAVGVFLTHCGWNSTLEGIAAGVVMLTWPTSADQFSNAQLLVEELGVGVRVGDGTEVIPESGELARILAESLDENRAERVRANKLRDAALTAVKGGSSDKDLDDFVLRLNALSK
ncbi:UDPGT domain-containing protein [Cephalotus follicularis]|uniref:UDPGT domain-containing protein n=1 Tax=Cephalotus follicularis TaxID=3775 RepID=A0A1Q3AL64_CEPFO|nr:UDPGT domain-containing protein [Cephalotus follicularis]